MITCYICGNPIIDTKNKSRVKCKCGAKYRVISVNPISVIKYHKDMVIKNVESLPHGLNTKYLEVMISHNNDLVAYAWRRKIPKNIPGDHKLIMF